VCDGAAEGAAATEVPIDDDVLALIRDFIRSIWAVELLMLLRTERGREWNEAELVLELRGSGAIVRESLAALTAAGLVTIRQGYSRFQPRTAVLGRVAEQLAEAYERQPSTVMKAIAAAPDNRIRTLADAFRFKQ
jgi:hypothetical protein